MIINFKNIEFYFKRIELKGLNKTSKTCCNQTRSSRFAFVN